MSTALSYGMRLLGHRKLFPGEAMLQGVALSMRDMQQAPDLEGWILGP